MLDESFSSLRQDLIRHEGLRLKPYRDSVGKLTIGVGRNLDDVGISELEAMLLLTNDIKRTAEEAYAALPWLRNLDPLRTDVVLNMIFNMGLQTFQGFHGTIAAIAARKYEEAADHMLASKWATQVGPRARELSFRMRTGTRLWDGK